MSKIVQYADPQVLGPRTHGGTSRFASHLIGEQEVVRAERSRGSARGGFFSKPGHDSSSEEVSFRHVTEQAVMASEIEQLADLQGFLKLASNPAWIRVALTLTS